MAPSTAVATIASMLPACHGAQSIPAAPRLADDRVDLGSLVLGSPIADRDQPPNLGRRQRGGDLRKRSGNRAAHRRSWIEQEQNRDATRFGDAGKRQAHGHGAAGFRRHGMTAFDQRADGQKRIAVARFEDAGESSADVGWQRSVLVSIDELIGRCRGKLRRCRDFRLVQGSSHKGKHATVDVSGLDLRDDVGLKIRDQLACVRVAPIGAITQMLQQPLQQKQITDRKRLILAGRRHVASCARESREDFA